MKKRMSFENTNFYIETARQPDIDEEDPEVGAPEVKGEELALLLACGQLPHVGRVALHARLANE